MQSRLIVGIALALAAGCANAETAWPDVALPKEASRFAIAEQMTVNGLPMRMQGFVSKSRLPQVAQWFRDSLGQPLVENAVASKLILGRAQGDYYMLIQLESIVGASDAGTRGLVAISQLKTAYDNRSATRAATERLLSRLPSGSRLVSQMASTDGDKQASYVVISNSYNADLNRDRLTGMLRDDGFTLEREAQAASDAGHQLPGSAGNGKSLFFKGPGKEAMAVIVCDEAGRTTVVLNTITVIERFK